MPIYCYMMLWEKAQFIKEKSGALLDYSFDVGAMVIAREHAMCPHSKVTRQVLVAQNGVNLTHGRN